MIFLVKSYTYLVQSPQNAELIFSNKTIIFDHKFY